jgi:hypothetical protein
MINAWNRFCIGACTKQPAKPAVKKIAIKLLDELRLLPDGIDLPADGPNSRSGEIEGGPPCA